MNHDDTFEPGSVVDGFTIGDACYSGGMATIYRVSHPDQTFPLAMKVPRRRATDPASNIVSFEVEQMLLGVLTGPHVPRLFAVGDLMTKPYCVMEFVEGTPLSQLREVADEMAMAADQVAEIGAAVARAVHSLHAQDVVHLDLKPSNIILRDDGEVVLIDFGLAHHGGLPDLLSDDASEPMGSAPYMAPEQVLGVRCDPRSDIFAMGAMFYQLAVGHLPFGSPTSQNGLRRRLWQEPPPPRAVLPDFPPWLQEVILCCLEVEAERRYGSAAQVGFDLAHPTQIKLGTRAERIRPAGLGRRIRRYVRAAGYEPAPCPPPSSRISEAPIVVVGVATNHTNEASQNALRGFVRHLVQNDRVSRFVLVTVMREGSAFGASTDAESAPNLYLRYLAALREWAQPLGVDAERLSYHVLESNDPPGALLKYASSHRADHIVVGMPPRRADGSVGGGVASRLLADAECTVTVVRTKPGEH